MTAVLLGNETPNTPEWDALRTSESWASVPRFEGHYEISSFGRVRSLKYGKQRMLHLSLNSDGYAVVGLLLRGKRVRSAKVHDLVAETFIGPRPGGLEVRHLNGYKQDNVVWNLAYGTRSQNQIDNVDHGVHHLTARTHCPQNHPYDEANTYYKPESGRRAGRSHRVCRACSREAHRRYLKRRAVAP